MVENTQGFNWLPHLYEPFRQVGQRVADWFSPRSEAAGLDGYYEINVELPGVKSEEVEVTVHGNSLMVRGKKEFNREEKGRTYFFSERRYGAFQRTFTLPGDADADKIDGQFTDGVLHLKIAKQTPAKSSEKKIEVRKA